VILALSLALLVGGSLGLLGGGGSILTVPIFVYVLGIEPKAAIAMSLGVVGVVSLAGAVSHWRDGRVDTRIALVFGAVAMVGTYLGARLSVLMSGAAQLVLFAAVMLVAAVFMYRDRPPSGPDSAPVRSATLRWTLIGLEGIAVGILTGLVGVGGGFLIVPALVLLADLPMKLAVGTSLLVIAMKSASGFVGYLGTPGIDAAFMATFSAAAVVGIVIGSRFVRIVPQRALRKTFAGFLVVMGALILYQNLP
jgi:uncharacterized membrane protein YfcA